MDEKGIPIETKRGIMEKWGVTPELLARLEAFNLADEQKALAEGRQSKDNGAAAPETPAVETKEDGAVETQPETPVAEKAQGNDYDMEMKEIVEAVSGTMAAVISLADQVKTLQKEIAALKQSDAEKIASKEASTPIASLMSLMHKSVVGSEAAAVDGRTKLAKSGPVENKDNGRTSPAVMGIPTFLDAWAHPQPSPEGGN